MARKRKPMPGPPAIGGYEFEVLELGPPVYFTPPPPVKARGGMIPVGDGEDFPPRPAPNHLPSSNVLLVPTVDEIAQLPRLAQLAFAERCALRVKPVRDSGIATAADAARVILETATIDSPLTAQLRCIRRDFVRLKRLGARRSGPTTHRYRRRYSGRCGPRASSHTGQSSRRRRRQMRRPHRGSASPPRGIQSPP